MIDPFSLHFCIATLFMAILGLAFVTDLHSFRIPNRFCIALVLLYPAHLMTSAAAVDWPGSLLVAGLIFVVGLLPFSGGVDGRRRRRALMAATALWLGPQGVLPFLAVTSLVGGLVAIVMLTRIRFCVARAAEVVGLSEVGEALLGRGHPLWRRGGTGRVDHWRTLSAGGGRHPVNGRRGQ